MQCSCSSWLSVGVSPVVPTATRPWLPSATCQFTSPTSAASSTLPSRNGVIERGDGAFEHGRALRTGHRDAGTAAKTGRGTVIVKRTLTASALRGRRAGHTLWYSAAQKQKRSSRAEHAHPSLLPVLLAGLWLGLAPPPPAQTTAQARAAGAGARRRRAPATGRRRRRWPPRPAARSRRDIVLWTRLRDGAGRLGRVSATSSPATRTGPGSRRCAAPASGRCRRACRREAVIAFFAGAARRPAPARCGWPRRCRPAAARPRPRPRSSAPGATFSMTGPERSAMLGALEAVVPAAPRGAARHAALARPDRRGGGDAAAGRRGLAAARPGAHRHPPRRRGAAVPDQHRARAAEGRPGPRLRALSLPGREGALAGGRGVPAREVALRRGARASRSMWMERRANLARQALEDGDVRRRLPDRGAELRQRAGRTTPTPSGWRASSR